MSTRPKPVLTPEDVARFAALYPPVAKTIEDLLAKARATPSRPAATEANEPHQVYRRQE